MLLVGPSKPERVKDRDQTRFDPKLHIRRLSLELTTPTCKKASVTEAAAVGESLLTHHRVA